jgi:hypothetical protein
MTLPFALVLAAVLVALAAYAQINVARFTASPAAATATRIVLLAVGAALGYIATGVAETPLLAFLYFVIGLGLPHVPAAFIVFFKTMSGAGKS